MLNTSLTMPCYLLYCLEFLNQLSNCMVLSLKSFLSQIGSSICLNIPLIFKSSYFCK
ncbi:hypothetical protein PRO82_000784 [Candidatus Protochlamydia amoebophila]|nr:hypothetical protein [Candidatus Protochlamydia amoebophila]